MAKREHQDSKFGMTYAEAMQEAMKVATRAARRYHRWVVCSSDKDDLLAAAYEGIILAWRAWKGPEVSSWGYTAWCYAELYAKREANRRKSVVSTGATHYSLNSGRQAVRDASLTVMTDDGEVVIDLEDKSASPAKQAETLECLRVVAAALRAAIPTVAGGNEALADDVIASRIMALDTVSTAILAKRHGVSPARVTSVEAALRATIAEI